MKLVIFDLDDTLVNFAATRRTAYECMAPVLTAEGVDAAAYLSTCADLDRPLFEQFAQGILTRQAYRLRRFSDPFERLGLAVPEELVARLNTLFMECVNDRPQLYDDVDPVLRALSARGMRTAILTNGPSDGQRRKLRATGLAQRVDVVVIGEELGVSKPSPRAFEAVLRHWSMPAADALMVGDSPALDYDAALAAGLQARLLDRDGVHGDTGRATIRTLDALLREAG
jgi:HAD superfamily hydrolase (TIGR01549 family)